MEMESRAVRATVVRKAADGTAVSLTVMTEDGQRRQFLLPLELAWRLGEDLEATTRTDEGAQPMIRGVPAAEYEDAVRAFMEDMGADEPDGKGE